MRPTLPIPALRFRRLLQALPALTILFLLVPLPALPAASLPASLRPLPFAQAPGLDLPTLRDIRPPRVIPLFTPAQIALLAAGACLLAGGLAVLALALWRRRRRPQALPETPYDRARRALHAAHSLRDNPDPRPFSAALSGALRQFLEDTLSIPAPERTTEEFLQLARRHPTLSGPPANALASFLEACDLVKFAGHAPGPDALRDLTLRAESLLDQALLAANSAASSSASPSPPPESGAPAPPPRAPARSPVSAA